MDKKVVIIDYQLGNMFSVSQACEFLGYSAVVSSNPDDLLNADYAILPGVGAFGDAMQNLELFGLTNAIKNYVNSGRPFMGVCLGLQLLMTESDEFGITKGLNLLPGKVKKFPIQKDDFKTFKVPQIQWNSINEPSEGKWKESPLKECSDGDYMYFVHSYYAQPDDDQFILTTTEYGSIRYCSSILKNNIFATQFHPEKSGVYGVNIYKEWFSMFY